MSIESSAGDCGSEALIPRQTGVPRTMAQQRPRHYIEPNAAQLPLYAQRPALTFVMPLTFLPVLLNHT